MKLESYQEKCEYIIKELGYNSRQAAEVLGVSRQAVDKKIKCENKNAFTEADLKKLKKFIDDLNSDIKHL